MCFFSIPVHYTPRRRRRIRIYVTKYIRPTSNLSYLSRSSPPALSLSIGLWNCQCAVNKADFIPAFASHASLDACVLTETWIRPENNSCCSLRQPLILPLTSLNWARWWDRFASFPTY